MRVVLLLLLAFSLRSASSAAPVPASVTHDASASGVSSLNQPIAVYNNWSAYDELSDNIELTEELALRELREILRLRRAGVRIDYYVMDAFWYATNGAYREFRQPHWPNGPDRWLQGCLTNGIKPGLWVASNVPFRINPAPEWLSSMDATGSAMCLFQGGFLPDLVRMLQFWYERGVRMFKFDFANFSIATPAAARSLTKTEIFNRNCAALRNALIEFRKKNPEVIFAAFNGFGSDTQNEGTFAPVRTGLDLRWLQAFDSLYCGDPRLSDVPMMNFWRSMDLYTDHMVRYFEAAGAPLERIDNTGCMTGVAGTCYARRTQAWKSMILLEHARGGWMNVYYGNLELIDNARARWLARVQQLYFHLQSIGRTFSFGALPGLGEPYGFCSLDASGSLYVAINPSQSARTFVLPKLVRSQTELGRGRIQFRDAGFQAGLAAPNITLGPEQMAIAGFGEYAKPKYDLGVQDDVIIPKTIQSLKTGFTSAGSNSISGTLSPPITGDLRDPASTVHGGRRQRKIQRSWQTSSLLARRAAQRRDSG